MTEEMIARMASRSGFVPPIPPSLQSGCDATLRRMRCIYDTLAGYRAVWKAAGRVWRVFHHGHHRVSLARPRRDFEESGLWSVRLALKVQRSVFPAGLGRHAQA